MMDELRSKVEQAVHVLNHDSHSGNRLAANQWLLHFQQTDSVWEVATSVLCSSSSSNFDFEVHFFAAQILKSKIQKEGRFLPPSVKDAVFNSLLSAAKTLSSGPPQLLTQICLALGALMLQTVHHGKPIEHLFQNLRNLQCETNGDLVVLELLTVLPEEVANTSSKDSRINLEQKSLYGRELLTQAHVVLKFLTEESLKIYDDHLQALERSRKILRCLLSWVRVGCFSEIPSSSLGTHPLINFVFKSLTEASLFNLDIEVLVELASHREFTRVILDRLPYLKELLFFPALCTRNDNIVHGMACLMSEVGQAVPNLVVESIDEAFSLSDALLRCVSFPSAEWEIADITLQFWSGLAQRIFSIQSNNSLLKDQTEAKFFPFFSSLIDALLQRAKVDESTFNEKSQVVELPDSLAQFRKNLAETLLDICQLLKPVTFIQKLSVSNWDDTKDVEVKLFALNSVAELILREVPNLDISMILRLVAMFSNIYSQELEGFMGMVYASLVEVIGSYSKRIRATEIDLMPLLIFLTHGIAAPPFSMSCACTLRKLCEEFSSTLCKPSCLEILFWMGEATGKYQLPSESEEDVVGAMILILRSVQDNELKKNLLMRFLSSSFDAVKKLTDEENYYNIKQNPTTYSYILKSAVKGLGRIGNTFDHMTSETLSVTDDIQCELLKMFWSLLEKLLRSDHVKSGSLSTASCRSLSAAIQYSGQHLLTLLPSILDCLSTSFLSSQTTDCYIRTATVAIAEFGSMGEFSPLFLATFQRFTQATSLSSLSSSYACDQQPDLVEAYTNFASAFVGASSKETLVASQLVLEVSFEKSAFCCAAMHRSAAMSAMSYLSCFLDVAISSILESGNSSSSNTYGLTSVQIISRGSDRFVTSLVYALLGVSAMSRVHKCATLLQQLAAICFLCERLIWNHILSWNSLRQSLEAAVRELPDGYLNQWESETLIPRLLEALLVAASEYVESKIGDTNSISLGYIQGKGGKALKRVLREFADTHRHVPIVN